MVSLVNCTKIAKQDRWECCIYGLGNIGRTIKGTLFEYFGLMATLYSDMDDSKVEQFSMENATAISKEKLFEIKNEILIFVLVDSPHGEGIANELNKKENMHAFSFREICQTSEVIKSFYGQAFFRKYSNLKDYHYESIFKVKKELPLERIAVYTCITGGYDTYIPPRVYDDVCDYYVISDAKPINLGKSIFIDVNDIVPKEIENAKDKNRYCKMHSVQIFPKYRYSIYLDGQVQINGELRTYISYIGDSGLAIHKARVIDCLYVEGMILSWNGRAKKENVLELMEIFSDEGMPKNYGSFECTVIVRDHSVFMGECIMKKWFEAYMNVGKCKRDQLVLPYVLWKLGYTKEVIGYIKDGIQMLTNDDFKISFSVHDCQNVNSIKL